MSGQLAAAADASSGPLFRDGNGHLLREHLPLTSRSAAVHRPSPGHPPNPWSDPSTRSPPRRFSSFVRRNVLRFNSDPMATAVTAGQVYCGTNTRKSFVRRRPSRSRRGSFLRCGTASSPSSDAASEPLHRGGSIGGWKFPVSFTLTVQKWTFLSVAVFSGVFSISALESYTRHFY